MRQQEPRDMCVARQWDGTTWSPVMGPPFQGPPVRVSFTREVLDQPRLAAACATRPDTPGRVYCDRQIAGAKTGKKRWPHGEPRSRESPRTGIAPR
jgi:hypothetical protein